MFTVLLLAVKDLLIPLGFIFWQWQAPYRSRFDALLLTLLAGGYVGFIYFTADWALYGYYLRYGIVFVFLLYTGRLFFRIQGLPFWKRKNPREKFGLATVGFLTLLFVGLSAWAYWGKFYSGEAVELVFPLREGRFYILEGGDSPLLNLRHHAFPPVPPKYALDIVKIDSWGRRAAGFYPAELHRYRVFGEPVYSPCAGTVVSRVDSFPDQLNAPNIKSEKEALGNRLVVATDGDIQVVLAQLQQHSLAVSVGDTVAVGELLGRVGASGEVSEPHLHIHASRASDDPRLRGYWRRAGLPILFQGRFLVKNDIVDMRTERER